MPFNVKSGLAPYVRHEKKGLNDGNILNRDLGRVGSLILPLGRGLCGLLADLRGGCCCRSIQTGIRGDGDRGRRGRPCAIRNSVQGGELEVIWVEVGVEICLGRDGIV